MWNKFFKRRFVNCVNLFLILTIGVFCVYPQTPENLPAFPVKSKPGLIKVNNNLAYGAPHPLGLAALAFDDLYAFAATPNGLYRTPLPLSPNNSFELIGFQNKAIFNLYVHNNELYVLKYSEPNEGSPATDHAFLKSADHGATFVPMDGALQYCLGGYCSFLWPTQAIFKNNLIFLNAGGAPNLLVSTNNGASWIPLLGSLQAQICTAQPFELINNRAVVGGECPLDSAYIRGGTLRPDMLGWTQFPTNVAAPDLQNRNIQFIKNKPGTTDVYAGAEGGLLKSTDSGQSFRFVIKYAISGGVKYPYISDILFSSEAPNVIVVGGFDKGPQGGAFLAYSKDFGETWNDISAQAQFFIGAPSKTKNGTDSVDFIEEDAQGNILAGVQRPETNTLKIFRLNIDVAAFR